MDIKTLTVKIKKNNLNNDFDVSCDTMVISLTHLQNRFLENSILTKKILADEKFQKANTPRFRNMLLASLFWKYLTI